MWCALSCLKEGIDARTDAQSARTDLIADDADLLNAADCSCEPRSRLRHRVRVRGCPMADGDRPPQDRRLSGGGSVAGRELLAGRRTSPTDELRSGRGLPHRQSGHASQPDAVLAECGHLRRGRDVYLRGSMVGTDAIMKIN